MPPPVMDACWRPDPTRRFQARYWDGAAWTAHVFDGSTSGLETDPAVRPTKQREPASPAAAPTSQTYSALEAELRGVAVQPEESQVKREPIALFVLIMAGIFVVGLGGLVIGSAAWATFGDGNDFKGARSIVVSASLLTAAGAAVWWFDRTWKRLWNVVLLVVILTLPGSLFLWGFLENDSATDPGQADTVTGDSNGFSIATCSATWLQLDPATAAQLGPRSDFMDLCTSPGNRSFMCDFDPAIPEC